MNNSKNDGKKSTAETGIMADAQHFVQVRHAVYTGGRWYTYGDDHYHQEEDISTALTAWFQGSGYYRNRNQLANIVQQAKAMALDDMALPYWRDGRGGQWIAFRNGILSVDAARQGSVVLLPHTPNWVSSSCLPYDFDSDAECPRWLTFLGEVLTDPAEQNLLGEWLGYCMSLDVSREVLMFLVGLPRSGKGTILKLLTALVGAENATGFELSRLVSRFGLAPLMNKQVVTIGEAEIDERPKIIHAKLLSIVGRDPQTVEEKGVGRQPSVILPGRFTVACNSVPHMYDDAGAMGERMLMLVFKKSFADRPNRKLLSELTEELPGIAKWALAGLVRLDQQGWSMPSSSARKQTAVRRDTNPTLAFMADCLVVHRDLATPLLHGVTVVDDYVEAWSDDLAKVQRTWAQEEEVSQTSAWCMRKMSDLLPHMEPPVSHWHNGGKHKLYKGIGLKPR